MLYLLGKLFCQWSYADFCEDKAEPTKVRKGLDLALACMTKERCQDVSRWKSFSTPMLQLSTTVFQVSIAHTLSMFDVRPYLEYTLLCDLDVSRTFFFGASGNLFSFSLLTCNDRCV